MAIEYKESDSDPKMPKIKPAIDKLPVNEIIIKQMYCLFINKKYAIYYWVNCNVLMYHIIIVLLSRYGI